MDGLNENWRQNGNRLCHCALFFWFAGMENKGTNNELFHSTQGYSAWPRNGKLDGAG
jgi:hypothetical protein